MDNISGKKVLKYAALPGIKPRLYALFGGFSFFSSLLAQIYGMAGLLPPTHPYLNASNAGRFHIHHVIAEAANNLTLSRENLDKIFIFCALFAGVVLLFLQFIVLFGMIFMQMAWAGTIPAITLFDTVHPEKDIAFNLLAQIFGIPEFFCSASSASTCAENSPADAGAILPMQQGLHALFKFYSYGLLLIGFLIFLYFIVVIVVETATTGTPFGQRFQNVWVPVRLVVAIGLLVPINYGLNSGQYITLYAAKLGSSLATNGWLRYNNTIANHSLFSGGGANPSGEKHTLIAVPKQTSMAEVAEAMSIVHACAYSYWATKQGTKNFGGGRDYIENGAIQPYFVKSIKVPTSSAVQMAVSNGTTLKEALDFYGNRDIVITFGEQKNDYEGTGGVQPFCGSIRIPVVTIPEEDAESDGTYKGPARVLNKYYEFIRDLWFADGNIGSLISKGGIRFYEVSTHANMERIQSSGSSDQNFGCQISGAGIPSGSECSRGYPTIEWSKTIVDGSSQALQVDANNAITQAWVEYVQEFANIEIEDEILKRGWGGSGMWFNRLAELNGRFSQVVISKPEIIQYPSVMEAVRNAQRQAEGNVTGTLLFNPEKLNGTGKLVINGMSGAQDYSRAEALYQVYRHWNEEQWKGDAGSSGQVVYNVFMDAFTMIFGVDGLLDMRKDNAHTHPLSQLIMVGKGLVDSTLRNLTIATGSSFLGGILSSAGGQSGGALVSAIGGFFSQTAYIGLTAGLILYYIVPFLPFVYFFFAVGTWVKSIFEAMVGVPLWALAHLRLDGEGLPGESASNGYFLILEIFIRPILIVFGLLAALIIFTGQVRVLHFIWDLVVENAAGFATESLLTATDGTTERMSFRRSVIDEFFFTVIYTIIVYMMATASFKLIDNIPNSILRWGGAGVSAFGDQSQDALEGLQRYVAQGGMVQGQQLVGGINDAAGKLGGQAGRALGLQGALAQRGPGGGLTGGT